MQTPDLKPIEYEHLRRAYDDITVLGGVRFKYTKPTGKSLEDDLKEAMPRCEAIVTTGDGTGTETPLRKLIQFRKKQRDFPLIVGAGVTDKNAYEQLAIADAAIVGSYFKPQGNIEAPVQRDLVKSLMDVVRSLRTVV